MSPRLVSRARTDAGVAGGAVAGVAAVLVVVLGVFLIQGNRSDDAEPLNADRSTPASDSGSPSEDPSESPDEEPTSDEEAWLAEVRTAAKDGFPAFVPAEVPSGWTVDEAAYEKDARWTMTFTAPSGAAVTLEQVAGGDMQAVMESLIGSDAEHTGTVDLRRWGTGRWQAYDGDGVALGNDLANSAVVVGGDTSRDELVELVKQLLTAEMVVNVGDGSDG